VTLVVDASVACKWIVAEIDTGAAEALVASGQMLLATDLIAPVICNVAWLKLRRGEITAEQAAALVDGLPDLLDELVPSVQWARRALEIAMTVSHSAFDCFYIALAEMRDTRVVIDDRRLIARLAATPWSRLVVKFGEFAAGD